MTRPTEEEIVAYLDGELSDAAHVAFEARIADDPALAEAVRRHRETVERVRAAYSDYREPAFDARALESLGLGDPNVVELAAVRERRGLNPWWASAIAASLVGGILIGRFMPTGRDFIADRNGQLIAAASLDKALTGQNDGGGGAIELGLTFRTASGYCRTFRLAKAYAGLACRAEHRWSIPALVKDRIEEPRSADFRLAGEDFPPALMAEVDARIVGTPLTPAEVTKARRADWR